MRVIDEDGARICTRRGVLYIVGNILLAQTVAAVAVVSGFLG